VFVDIRGNVDTRLRKLEDGQYDGIVLAVAGGLGFVIFVHELGHFAFAKIFGVKVLTFSIGFGPKILRLRGKETEYCVGLLPLGGFVKMLEESKRSEPILPEERHLEARFGEDYLAYKDRTRRWF